MPDRLLSPRDVARELNISIWSVYRLIRRGDLVAFKVGRRLRIPESSVDAFLELARMKPREKP
ncbi:MAG: helix-turn-helix domain-containing protein [Nitrososphaerota archaeon]